MLGGRQAGVASSPGVLISSLPASEVDMLIRGDWRRDLRRQRHADGTCYEHDRGREPLMELSEVGPILISLSRATRFQLGGSGVRSIKKDP